MLAYAVATGVVLAEQNIEFLGLGDRVFTMEGGRIAFGGTPADPGR